MPRLPSPTSHSTHTIVLQLRYETHVGTSLVLFFEDASTERLNGLNEAAFVAGFHVADGLWVWRLRCSALPPNAQLRYRYALRHDSGTVQHEFANAALVPQLRHHWFGVRAAGVASPLSSSCESAPTDAAYNSSGDAHGRPSGGKKSFADAAKTAASTADAAAPSQNSGTRGAAEDAVITASDAETHSACADAECEGALLTRFLVVEPRLHEDEALWLVGDHPALGEWDVMRALRMHRNAAFEWSVSVCFPPDAHSCHYKYIVAPSSRDASSVPAAALGATLAPGEGSGEQDSAGGAGSVHAEHWSARVQWEDGDNRYVQFHVPSVVPAAVPAASLVPAAGHASASPRSQAPRSSPPDILLHNTSYGVTAAIASASPHRDT
ncbi:MAG: hypothetical protein EOO41_00445, partial [Methanobacteriota archaeon]